MSCFRSCERNSCDPCNSCNPCCKTCPSTILTISKFASPQSISGATGVTGGFPQITFVIFVKNIGQHPACDVLVRDCFPTGMTLISVPNGTIASNGSELSVSLGTLSPGQLATLIISGNVMATTSGSYTNQAFASACNAAIVASAATFSVQI